MFNHNTLEQDIKRLSQDIAEKRSAPESKNVSERELVKNAVQPLLQESAPRPQPAQAQATDEDDSGLPAYLKDSPEEIKLEVEQMVDSVFHEGLRKTLAKAKKGNPFVLDAFHDALTDKLYDELKTRKLI